MDKPFSFIKIFLLALGLVITLFPVNTNIQAPPVVKRLITEDTIWRGHIHITDNVTVESRVTLTVLPGTLVTFKHYRGYCEPERRLGLIILGSIIAEGAPDQPIYFTSDAPDPQNGDWSTV